MTETTPVMVGEVGSLPVVLDPVTAGRLLGLGRTTTYRLLRDGAFPVPVHRTSRTWVIPTAGVLGYLGLPVGRRVRVRVRCGAVRVRTPWRR